MAMHVVLGWHQAVGLLQFSTAQVALGPQTFKLASVQLQAALGSNQLGLDLLQQVVDQMLVLLQPVALCQ